MFLLAMSLVQGASAPPQPRMQCTPALVAKATPVGWDRPVPAERDLRLGLAATVTMVMGARLATPSAKGGAATASLDFVVPRAGRWRVSLDSAAWVDVVRNGVAVASIRHGHGAACSGVRKQVDFDLTPGRYGLQLSGAQAGAVRVMVSPA